VIIDKNVHYKSCNVLLLGIMGLGSYNLSWFVLMDFHGEYLPKSLKWNIQCFHRLYTLLHTLDAAFSASGATLFSLGAIFCYVFLLNLYPVLFSVMLFYSTCIRCQYHSSTQIYLSYSFKKIPCIRFLHTILYYILFMFFVFQK
jgi:hypothetical protein